MGAYYVKVADNVEGIGIIHIIIFIPDRFRPITIEEIVNDALFQTGGDFMTNCEIYTTNWYIPYIYGEQKLAIIGDVWKKSSKNFGNIDFNNLKENQHLFVFEEGTLKSVNDIMELK